MISKVRELRVVRLLIPNFLLFIKPGISECGMVLPTFKVGFHSSFKHVWKPSYRHIQRVFPW